MAASAEVGGPPRLKPLLFYRCIIGLGEAPLIDTTTGRTEDQLHVTMAGGRTKVTPEKAKSCTIGLGDAPPIDTNMVRTTPHFPANWVAT